MQPAPVELRPTANPGIGISSISQRDSPDAKSIPQVADEVDGKQEARKKKSNAVVTS